MIHIPRWLKVCIILSTISLVGMFTYETIEYFVIDALLIDG